MDAIESALARAEPAEPLLTLRSRVTAYGGVEPVDDGDGNGCSVDRLPGIGILSRCCCCVALLLLYVSALGDAPSSRMYSKYLGF